MVASVNYTSKAQIAMADAGPAHFTVCGAYCLAGTAKDACACFSRIMRQPRPWTKQNFAPVEWIGRAQIGQEMIDLLPRAPRPMTRKETAMLHSWFGPEGRYPAVHLPTGQLRGI
jgi:hypothetical protein